MYSQNRFHVAKFEASGARCEIVAVHAAGLPPWIALADGSPLVRVAKGRSETPLGEVVVSTEPDAP
jgi:hypothetical protein